jgi:hypothetical protein
MRVNRTIALSKPLSLHSVLPVIFLADVDRPPLQRAGQPGLGVVGIDFLFLLAQLLEDVKAVEERGNQSQDAAVRTLSGHCLLRSHHGLRKLSRLADGAKVQKSGPGAEGTGRVEKGRNLDRRGGAARDWDQPCDPPSPRTGCPAIDAQRAAVPRSESTVGYRCHRLQGPP